MNPRFGNKYFFLHIMRGFHSALILLQIHKEVGFHKDLIIYAVNPAVSMMMPDQITDSVHGFIFQTELTQKLSGFVRSFYLLVFS